MTHLNKSTGYVNNINSTKVRDNKTITEKEGMSAIMISTIIMATAMILAMILS